MHYRFATLFFTGMFISIPAHGQLVDQFNPPRSNCCLPTTARNLADQMLDWNMLGRYNSDNQELKKQPSDSKRVVFMGDSITDFWRLADYFSEKPYVNRGIGGQTTSQMLVRMFPDVINLKPAAMVLLAGTNDIAQNTGPQTAEMVEQNIQAMTELAQHHGIKVILCAVLPVSDYPFLSQQNNRGGQPTAAQGSGIGSRGGSFTRTKMTDNHPSADILKLNAWMKDFAGRTNAIYVDYYGALVDEKGWLKEATSSDGLHPNAEGYKIMAPLVEAAIKKALQ
jgi:lysophospholipase L1-like esterase